MDNGVLTAVLYRQAARTPLPIMMSKMTMPAHLAKPIPRPSDSVGDAGANS